jgi:hypothetical protein
MGWSSGATRGGKRNKKPDRVSAAESNRRTANDRWKRKDQKVRPAEKERYTNGYRVEAEASNAVKKAC